MSAIRREHVRSGAWRGHTGRRSATSSTSASAAATSAPRWRTTHCAPTAGATLEFRFVSNVDGADLVRGVVRPRSRGDAVRRLVEDLHDARDAHERAFGAPLVRRRARGDERGRAALRRGIDERGRKCGVRDRYREHVRVLGLGRRAVLDVVGDRPVADGRDRARALRGAARRRARDGRALPDRAVRREPAGDRWGCSSCWYRDFLDAQTHAVVPYAQPLGKLPSYLQQLEMESNGKSVRHRRRAGAVPTGAIVWGTAGTNGQHAYFQLLHQGNDARPDRLHRLRARAARARSRRHQRLLVANLLAQAEALAFGTGDPEPVAPYRIMPGNRPSTVLLADQLDAPTLGALVAAYEHKVLTLGTLWGSTRSISGASSSARSSRPASPRSSRAATPRRNTTARRAR